MKKGKNVCEKAGKKKEEKVPVKQVHGVTALTQMKKVCQRRGFTVVRTHYQRFECYDKEGNLKQIVVDTTGREI